MLKVIKDLVAIGCMIYVVKLYKDVLAPQPQTIVLSFPDKKPTAEKSPESS